jgi:hypothetical protein
MSEYQYYEFQAVDRPLTDAERSELRALSTRATITSRSFINTYEWGGFKGSSAKLMERYFDLHLYLANWGTRHLSVRWPKEAIDAAELERFLVDESGSIRITGEAVILSVSRGEVDVDDWEDGSGMLAELAPLRTDVLEGDLRVFYLVWLMAVEDGVIDDDTPEPLPGLGPVTPSLAAFADFFCMNGDLVAAAAEQAAATTVAAPSPAAVADFIRALSDDEKVAMLVRLHDGDVAPLGSELRRRVRQAVGRPAEPQAQPRTAGELRAIASHRAAERKQAAERKAEAEHRRREAERAAARKQHLERLAARGDAAWRDVEQLIEQRNTVGYERAVTLLADLREIARGKDELSQFSRRLGDIRALHARKVSFLAQLAAVNLH